MLWIVYWGIRAIIVLVAIFAVIVICKYFKRKKAERPLTIEEKIVLLNNQLSDGTITKEEYDAQKADLLKNI